MALVQLNTEQAWLYRAWIRYYEREYGREADAIIRTYAFFNALKHKRLPLAR